jgi:hypothetical protein
MLCCQASMAPSLPLHSCTLPNGWDANRFEKIPLYPTLGKGGSEVPIKELSPAGRRQYFFHRKPPLQKPD